MRSGRARRLVRAHPRRSGVSRASRCAKPRGSAGAPRSIRGPIRPHPHPGWGVVPPPSRPTLARNLLRVCANFVQIQGLALSPRPSLVRSTRRALTAMEAIILAGGQAERLGDAAGGRPKALVDVAGKPLAAYQVGRLAGAGVEGVIISCAVGQGALFERELRGFGPEIAVAEEPERLGRGGGIKFAALERRESGDLFAMNGDELLDVDFASLLDRHRTTGAVATITVARPKSQFGMVELTGDDLVQGFTEVGRVPYWVNCGVYVLSPQAIGRFPDRGDHETTAFPELVRERSLRAFRHEGLWLTVNTPKELRTAVDHVTAHPEWLTA